MDLADSGNKLYRSCRILSIKSLKPYIIALVLEVLSIRAAFPSHSNTLLATLDRAATPNSS